MLTRVGEHLETEGKLKLKRKLTGSQAPFHTRQPSGVDRVNDAQASLLPRR